MLWKGDEEVPIVRLKTRSWVFLIILLSTLGLSGEETARFEFEIAGMSCNQCAMSATRALRNVDGVRTAEVDFETKRAVVVGQSDLSRDSISRALADLGFEARFPGETLLPRLSQQERNALDIAVASRGERIDLADHLAENKITIFDFWAEWCGPCHLLTPKLERLVQSSEGEIALRTIDLQDWSSAAARQATEEFRMPGLPYVRIYDSDGRFIGAVVGNHIDQIEALIDGWKKR